MQNVYHLKMFNFRNVVQLYRPLELTFIDGSELGSGLIWVELLQRMLSLGSWITSPELMMADWIACRLTAMSVLVAVISLMIEIRTKSLVNLKEI